jgi:hypothetical protein
MTPDAVGFTLKLLRLLPGIRGWNRVWLWRQLTLRFGLARRSLFLGFRLTTRTGRTLCCIFPFDSTLEEQKIFCRLGLRPTGDEVPVPNRPDEDAAD